MTNPCRVLIGVLLALTSGGCIAPAFVAHPNIDERAPRVKKIALLPPQIDIFEIGAGGVLEKIDEWSTTGADNVSNALLAELGKRKGLQISQLDIAALSEETKSELEQTRLLFDAVSSSIMRHAYGRSKTPRWRLAATRDTRSFIRTRLKTI